MRGRLREWAWFVATWLVFGYFLSGLVLGFDDRLGTVLAACALTVLAVITTGLVTAIRTRARNRDGRSN
jgi:energy-converting hydrogenase Eha subunit B